MSKTLIQLLIFLGASYLVLCLLMYMLQHHLLYFPTSPSKSHKHEMVDISANSLNVKVVSKNIEAKDAVIYFGGNAESVYDSANIMQPAFAGFAAYYVNYPGYGGSEGRPSEKTIFAAANQVFKYVQGRHENVSLVGRSLGTGVAIEIASQYPVNKVILITPYDSIAAVAATHYPIFPTSWLIKDKFDSKSRALTVSADVLMLVAGRDSIIPNQHSENLQDALMLRINDKELALNYSVFEQYNHNNIQQAPEFMQSINVFLNQ